MKNVDKFQLS